MFGWSAAPAVLKEALVLYPGGYSAQSYNSVSAHDSDNNAFEGKILRQVFPSIARGQGEDDRTSDALALSLVFREPHLCVPVRFWWIPRAFLAPVMLAIFAEFIRTKNCRAEMASAANAEPDLLLNTLRILSYIR